ncbi:LacI family DNA-binding transcriptional regulator [Streptomyces sp. NBRC 109706]|uniref:LacI family DNA-binding transcriptional regulator n=1 Tax=Streptomyces sp. NBRC 109706 TaxID=1550035 RepID=UPI0007841D72|nr:LacI family DNA-binding transcriptional regulator [Streptomyces sp. NBRC 109706]
MDVAALAGVSKSAVSKVFNNRDGISGPTRERILDAAEKLGWSPSAHAMALRGERTRTVGLVIARDPDLLTADPFFAETVAGLEEEFAPAGYGLRLHLVGAGQAESDCYEQLVRQRRVDAFLLTDHRIGDSRHELLRRLRVPGLLIGRPWQGEPAESVHALGLEEATAAAVDHLIDLRHRRIAYVAGPEDRVHGRLRRVHLEAELGARGLRLRTRLDTELTGEAASHATTALLADPDDRPTAILYPNDAMALTGIATAQRMGLRVPDDVSVIGHDDHPLGQWLHPRLTTITQDARQVSRAAARRLLSLLGEPADAAPEPPTARLVIRESTGPAPGRP